jgi:serine/threonine protein kinase
MRHVREVKLQWDYNISSYNLHGHHGVLCNRYVLLNMFGKGGFAEVRDTQTSYLVPLTHSLYAVCLLPMDIAECQVTVQVFRAYDVETGSEVALKIHCLDNKVPGGAAQKEYVRRAIREVAILEGLRHQCVVRLHHVFEISETSFAIVMEACKGKHFVRFCHGSLQT